VLLDSTDLDWKRGGGRLPVELLSRDDIHVLMCSVASDTPGTGRASAGSENDSSWINCPQGCEVGARLKICLRIGVDNGFGAVVVVGGTELQDTAPVLALVNAWAEREADVALATAQRSNDDAPAARLRDRMLNRLSGLSISDYRSSCRLFSTSFLNSVPFESNDNGQQFGIELLLQAAYVGASIVEVPARSAAVSRGDQSLFQCSALRELAACLQLRLHRLGMLCSLKFRNLNPARYRDKSESLYSSHRFALNRIRELRPDRILDIGCGPGHVSRQCLQTGAEVTGVDVAVPEPDSMTRFHQCNLEADQFPADLWAYDVALFLDVIEHLASPEDFLVRLRNSARELHDLSSAPLLILSTPNVAFLTVRLNLLLGRFNYAERGILDITHKRLFTRHGLLSALQHCGYHVERVIPVGAPFESVLPGRMGRLLAGTSQILARLWPTVFAFQFMVEARPWPSARQLLTPSDGLIDTGAGLVAAEAGQPEPAQSGFAAASPKPR
jgi:SAM-dependent methyltransferase